jgi:hypothetical protein
MRSVAIIVSVGLLAGVGCKTKEEKLQQAEDDARFAADEKGRMAKGLGEAMQGTGKDGMQAISKGVGDVLKGAAKGLDESLSVVAVSTTPAVAEAGLRVERASRHEEKADAEKAADKKPAITAYLVADKGFAGTLLLRALGPDGKEVGRAKVAVKQVAGDAGYFDFVFDERVPLGTTDKFELGVLQ